MASNVKQSLGMTIHLGLGVALHSVGKLSGVTSGDHDLLGPVLFPPFPPCSPLGLPHPHKLVQTKSVGRR